MSVLRALKSRRPERLIDYGSLSRWNPLLPHRHHSSLGKGPSTLLQTKSQSRSSTATNGSSVQFLRATGTKANTWAFNRTDMLAERAALRPHEDRAGPLSETRCRSLENKAKDKKSDSPVSDGSKLSTHLPFPPYVLDYSSKRRRMNLTDHHSQPGSCAFTLAEDETKSSWVTFVGSQLYRQLLQEDHRPSLIKRFAWPFSTGDTGVTRKWPSP